jgi:hypothetical protein
MVSNIKIKSGIMIYFKTTVNITLCFENDCSCRVEGELVTGTLGQAGEGNDKDTRSVSTDTSLTDTKVHCNHN